MGDERREGGLLPQEGRSAATDDEVRQQQRQESSGVLSIVALEAGVQVVRDVLVEAAVFGLQVAVGALLGGLQ